MATREYFKEYNRQYYLNPVNRLKAIWRTMIFRCENPKSEMFYAYGKKGVRVCDEWKEFENFKKDMFGGYKKGLSIDRINNTGNYCKENCRWATSLEQAQNTSRSRFITYNGIKKTLSQWARDLGISGSKVRTRFYVYKWPINKCLNQQNYVRHKI